MALTLITLLSNVSLGVKLLIQWAKTVLKCVRHHAIQDTHTGRLVYV